jgi:hypothetical protein
MAKATRVCKVCGKEYECCHTLLNSANTFCWQNVACCPEHGKQYFDRILASRAKELEEISTPDDGKDINVFTADSADIVVVDDVVDEEDDDGEDSESDEDDDNELVLETE